MHGDNFGRVDHGREVAWLAGGRTSLAGKSYRVSRSAEETRMGRKFSPASAFRLLLRLGAPQAPGMSFSAVLKSIAFLAILFVMLYVGMNNPKPIEFNFPIAGTTVKDPIRAQAGLIYFGVFAVGVLAGTMLHGSSGKKRSSAGRDK